MIPDSVHPRRLLRTLPLGVLHALDRRRLVAPCYHLVTSDAEQPPHTRHLYAAPDVVRFERELDRLLLRCRPVSLDELKRSAADPHPEPGGRPGLFLSFDDGFREIAEVVAPLLLRKGVPATFFLTSGFLDNRRLGFRQKASVLVECIRSRPGDQALRAARRAVSGTGKAIGLAEGADLGDHLLGVRWCDQSVLEACARELDLDFEEYLRERRPFLTSEQARGLLRDGFSIGNHSEDHPLFSEIPQAERLRQVRACREDLRRRLDCDADTFAFPFVSDGVPSEFHRAVLEQDLASLIFSIGPQPWDNDPRLVERFGVEDRTGTGLVGRLKHEMANAAWARATAFRRRSR